MVNRGFKDRVNVMRDSTPGEDDGFGGVAAAEETTVASSYRCRFCPVKPYEQETLFSTFGVNAKDMWRVMGAWTSSVAANDYLKIVTSATLTTDAKYRIVSIDGQSGLANPHHLSMLVRKEE